MGDRGCWVGHGDCSAMNYCTQCVTYPGDCESYCALNALPHESNPYDSQGAYFDGPRSVLFESPTDYTALGAQVDPLAWEMLRLEELNASASVLARAWKMELAKFQETISHDCAGKFQLKLPRNANSGQRDQHCDACPVPDPEPTPVPTCGGNAGGQPCTLPFKYKGLTYNDCTSLDHHSKWCSTDSTYIGKWGHCECITVCDGKYLGKLLVSLHLQGQDIPQVHQIQTRQTLVLH